MLLAGKPLIIHSLQLMERHPRIDHIILVVSGQWAAIITDKYLKPYGITKVDKIVEGGADRCFSVTNAVNALAPSDDIVVIHDAVRPFVTEQQIDAVIDAATSHGASTLAARVTNTIKQAKGDEAFKTLDRSNLWSIQTPQAFKKDILCNAVSHAEKTGDFGTDECYIVEKTGRTVKLVEGTGKNIKVTTKSDLLFAESILRKDTGKMRIGTGYDAHRLVEERKLILGGVEIEHSKGLLGHSDADVLCHAICDAVLGALGQGDLGKHFPDTDSRYKGISSIKLLEYAEDLLEKNSFKIGNIDATVVAQKPKVFPFIEKMRENIAGALNTDKGNISIKATTTEGMGFEGREEGISAQAAVVIVSEK